MKYLFKSTLCILFIQASAAADTAKDILNKPNIVLILADDLGYADLSCYSKKSLIKTPAIDQLASEGIKFNNAHTPSSVCTPTRYSLLTGRYCWRTSLKKGVLFFYEPPLIKKECPTVGNLMQKAGYRTAFIGKWHLGLDWPTRDGKPPYSQKHIPGSKSEKVDESRIDFTKTIKNGPIERGFDYFYGNSDCSTCQPPYTYIENNKVTEYPSERFTGVSPGVKAPGFKISDVDVEYIQKSRLFLKNHKEKFPQKPFFLMHSASAVHWPFKAPNVVPSHIKEPISQMIYTMDWAVNELMATLDKLGYKNNTLVIFTSDNGPTRVKVEQRSGIYRGGKGTHFDGGFRVPFIARWPLKVPKNKVSSQLLCLTDIYATLSALVGGETSVNAEDSINMLPALLDHNLDKSLRKFSIHQSSSGSYCLKKDGWKIILGDTNGRNGNNKKLTPNKGMLFNLSNDPSEKVDLWKSHPEKVNYLMRILNEALK